MPNHEAPIINDADTQEEKQAEKIDASESREQGQIELREEFQNISKKLMDIWYKYNELSGDGSIDSVRPVDNTVYAELYSKIDSLSSELQVKMDGNVRIEMQQYTGNKAVGSVEAVLMFNLSNMLKHVKERLSEIKTYSDYYSDINLREKITRLHGIAEFWTEAW